MNASRILPPPYYSSSAFQQEIMPGHVVSDEMLDVEDIFASVFSTFDGEDDLFLMTDFGTQSQEPKAMMTPSPPAPSNTRQHFAAAAAAAVVSPTTSCAQLVYYAADQGADTDCCDPTPLADLMPSIPDSCSVISTESFHTRGRDTQLLFTSQQEKKKRVLLVSPPVHQQTKVKSARPTKKRRVATSSAASSTPNRAASLSPEKESVELTRQRNREHARKSRLRKKVFATSLQQSLNDLKAENEKLRAHIMNAFGSKKTESLVQERQAVRPAAEQFTSHLKQPENRVVDDSTLQFLRGLRKDVLASSPLLAKSTDELMDSIFIIG